MTFASTSEGRKEVSHVHIWGNWAPGRGNSQCKGPEVGVWLGKGRRQVELKPSDAGGE